MGVVSIKELLEAGVHFGHQTNRWNPKMKKFLFGERNGIYIIDLQQTLARMEQAYAFVRDTVAAGQSVLFVGTKRQAAEILQEAARRSGVQVRWEYRPEGPGEALRNKAVDIWPLLAVDPKRWPYARFSTPFLQNSYVVIAANSRFRFRDVCETPRAASVNNRNDPRHPPARPAGARQQSAS